MTAPRQTGAMRSCSRALLVSVLLLGVTGPLRAQDPQAAAVAPAIAPPTPAPAPFPEWLQGVREEALARRISPEVIAAALRDVTPVEQILSRDRTQAEFKETLAQYLARRTGAPAIRLGRDMAARHAPLLTRVEAEYKVPARVLVAVWGLESSFGRFSGVRPLMPTLATLAYDDRRSAMFRAQLFDALTILDQGFIELPRLRGSWAGAMGQPQFLPSSYLQYAVDFDGDGRKDIWSSSADVFASIGHYLALNGWIPGEVWGRPVRLPDATEALSAAAPLRTAGCRAARELTVSKPLAEWHALGVRTAEDGTLPSADMDASLLRTDAGAYLVYRNYEVLLSYNCAHAYAMAVAHLSDRIGDTKK